MWGGWLVVWQSRRYSMAAWVSGQRGKGVKDSSCADSESPGLSLTSASLLSSYSINPYAVESEQVLRVHVQNVSDCLVWGT